MWKHPSSALPSEGGWVQLTIIHQYHNLPPPHHHNNHNHHCITQVSDDLLRQMGSVDYEAVQRDLTLLMTDSQVVITLHYSQAVNTRMIRILWVVTMVKGLLSQSWHIHIQYVTSRNHGQQIMVTTGLLWWGLLGTARALTGDVYNDAHNRKCVKIVMIQIMNEWWS